MTTTTLLLTITTTAGEEFTHNEHVDLARLIYKRFGNSLTEATRAWSRLLKNTTEISDFLELLECETHTPHCRGECQYRAQDAYSNKQ